jgi:hypothetical protein
MKMYGDVEVYFYAFIKEISRQLHPPAALSPGEKIRNPLERRLCETESQYGLLPGTDP